MKAALITFATATVVTASNALATTRSLDLPISAETSIPTATVVTALARATDPRFTFDGSASAFAAARNVTMIEALGEWTVVGRANNPSLAWLVGQDFYAPDGRFLVDGMAGSYYFREKISALRDAFGRIVYSNVESMVGAESGQVYSSSAPLTVLPGETGMTILVPGTPSICSTRAECRLVDATEMLLCKLIAADERKVCQDRIPLGETVRYFGHVKFASK